MNWRPVLILVLAVALEMVYGMFLILVLGDGQEAFAPLGLSSAVAIFVLGGWWIAATAKSSPILQAGWVGIAAVIFYNLINVGARLAGADASPYSDLVQRHYLGHHLLKIAAAVLGGSLGARRASAKTSA